MATRRQGLKRIKKRRLSERSEFPTLPVSVPGGACSQRVALTAIVGAAFFAPLFWRSKKAGRLPGRNPAWSSDRTSVLLHQRAAFSREAAVAVAAAARVHSAKAKRHCRASLADEALHSSLPWGVAGCSSRRPTRFFAPPKKWDKKGGPYDGGQRYALTARAARN